MITSILMMWWHHWWTETRFSVVAAAAGVDPHVSVHWSKLAGWMLTPMNLSVRTYDVQKKTILVCSINFMLGLSRLKYFTDPSWVSAAAAAACWCRRYCQNIPNAYRYRFVWNIISVQQYVSGSFSYEKGRAKPWSCLTVWHVILRLLLSLFFFTIIIFFFVTVVAFLQ